jgi:hypothetical protein
VNPKQHGLTRRLSTSINRREQVTAAKIAAEATRIPQSDLDIDTLFHSLLQGNPSFAGALGSPAGKGEGGEAAVAGAAEGAAAAGAADYSEMFK